MKETDAVKILYTRYIKGHPLRHLRLWWYRIVAFLARHGRGRLNEKQKEWHKKYKDTIKARAGLSNKEARMCLEAAMPDVDYEDDPVDAVEDELSYWRT